MRDLQATLLEVPNILIPEYIVKSNAVGAVTALSEGPPRV